MVESKKKASRPMKKTSDYQHLALCVSADGSLGEGEAGVGVALCAACTWRAIVSIQKMLVLCWNFRTIKGLGSGTE